MALSRRLFSSSLVALPWFATASAQVASPTRAVAVSLAGVGNLHRVTPTLYRGAQPTREGFALLAEKLGIRTIVSLREWHSDAGLAAGLPLALERVPINTWHIGDDNGEKIVRALRLIRAGEKAGRAFVHCQHGSDRTGAIIALYRILFQGQTKDAAKREMMKGGFGFHAIWAELPEWGNIPAYIDKVDVRKLRQRVEVA